MHRSHSTVGSFINGQTEKPTKKTSRWRSLLGQKETKADVSPAAISEATPTLHIPRSLTTKSSLNKRSSLILPSESRTRSIILDKGIQMARHMSTACDLSALKVHDVQTTDPKELEFYAKLLAPDDRGSIIEEEENDDENEVDAIDENDLIDMSFNNEKSRNLDTNTEETSLSSALEDYRLFTSKNQNYFSPTESNFDHQVKDNSSDQPSLPSIPSFVSTKTIESSASIKNISHSLWVGSEILDLDEGLEKQNEEYYSEFLDVDAKDIFDDHPCFIRDYRNVGSRTSLIFL